MQLCSRSCIFFISVFSSLIVIEGSTLHRASNQTSKRPFDWVLNLDTWESKDPDSILPNAIYTSCGGVIPITTALDQIDYQPSGHVLPNQRCVWVLSSEYAFLEVFVDFERYTGNTGVSVLTLVDSEATTLTRLLLEGGDKTNYDPIPSFNVAFIVFSSMQLQQGQGFRLAVRGSGARTASAGFKSVFKELSGTFVSHAANYANNERSWVVIQPPVNYVMTMAITALDTEAPNHDILYVYKLLPYQTPGTTIDPDPPAGHEGFHPFGLPLSPSREPCVFFLRTDNTVTRKGFSLRWG